KIDKETLENFPVERLDWERISTVYVLSRTANQCLMQWTTQEHPIINKKPWSKQESSQLSKLVDQIGLNSQWERIANELGTGRTISQCFSHYMAYKNNKQAKSLKWTSEEDKKLTEAVKTFGNCNWQQIASMLKGRTGQQCLHRWEKSINPAIKRTKWTDKESDLMRRAVQLYGLGSWTKVQRLLPGRTDMQCRERWVNVLMPEVEKGKMNEEEIQQLASLVEQ
ncbi:Homeodomain-like protein, partial [Thamnidium elegans]